MNLLLLFSVGLYTFNALLLILYTIVLFRLWTGTKFKTFITLTILLIISSVFRVLNLISSNRVDFIYFNGGGIMPWGTVNAISYNSTVCFFSLAHWLFAIEYYTIVEVMPLALKGLKLSPEKERKIKIIKYAVGVCLVVLNVVLVFIFFFAYLTLQKGWSEERYDSIKIAQNVLTSVLGFINFTIGIVLLYTVSKIY